jgi:hypothetical protein
MRDWVKIVMGGVTVGQRSGLVANNELYTIQVTGN